MIISHENDLIFLLGAGASVDAGLPTVDQLTKQLRTRLLELSDVNGIHRPEFGEVFNLIEACDPLVGRNYERFFEWIKLLLDCQKEPFRKIIETKISPALIEAMAHLSFVIGGEISRLLNSIKSIPDYLTRLADFLPEKGRLKVFTINYDCCVEDACRIEGIDVTTGFDSVKRKWKPSLFQSKSKGVNLYKLHGSLRWNSTRDLRLSGDRIQYNLVPMELQLEQRSNIPGYIDVHPGGWLVLGPGNKMQSDDPFITLFYEFHRSLHAAKVCVVIGYSYHDPHINTVLDLGIDRGVSLVDANSGGPCGRYLASKRYYPIRLTAKNALMSGAIKSKIEELKQ